MDKIDFKNLPNTSSPINANNLNLLQDNIENAIEQTDDKIPNVENDSNYVVIGDTLIIWGVQTVAVASGSNIINITFPKNFANTNYSFVVTKSTVGNSTALYPTISTKTTDNCALDIFNAHSGAINNNFNYMIIGKVANN